MSGLIGESSRRKKRRPHVISTSQLRKIPITGILKPTVTFVEADDDDEPKNCDYGGPPTFRKDQSGVHPHYLQSLKLPSEDEATSSCTTSASERRAEIMQRLNNLEQLQLAILERQELTRNVEEARWLALEVDRRNRELNRLPERDPMKINAAVQVQPPLPPIAVQPTIHPASSYLSPPVPQSATTLPAAVAHLPAAAHHSPNSTMTHLVVQSPTTQRSNAEVVSRVVSQQAPSESTRITSGAHTITTPGTQTVLTPSSFPPGRSTVPTFVPQTVATVAGPRIVEVMRADTPRQVLEGPRVAYPSAMVLPQKYFPSSSVIPFTSGAQYNTGGPYASRGLCATGGSPLAMMAARQASNSVGTSLTSFIESHHKPRKGHRHTKARRRSEDSQECKCSEIEERRARKKNHRNGNTSKHRSSSRVRSSSRHNRRSASRHRSNSRHRSTSRRRRNSGEQSSSHQESSSRLRSSSNHGARSRRGRQLHNAHGGERVQSMARQARFITPEFDTLMVRSPPTLEGEPEAVIEERIRHLPYINHEVAEAMATMNYLKQHNAAEDGSYTTIDNLKIREARRPAHCCNPAV